MQHDQSPVPPGSSAGALRASPPPARRREAGAGRNAGTLWTERGSRMNATRIAKALGERAEEVCRAYLPHGRRQGRYWTAGDIRGARGRSLFVRLTPPGVPGKWTDYVAPVVMLRPGAGWRSCSRFAVSPQHNLSPAGRVA